MAINLAEDIRRALKMTAKQFAILLPGGIEDRDGYPGALVTDEPEKSYKQQLRDEAEAEGWRVTNGRTR